MTNNENKTAEQFYLELYSLTNRDSSSDNEQTITYKELIHFSTLFAFQQSQSALGEKDGVIQRMAQRMQEIDRGYCKKIEGLQSQLSLKDKEIEGLKDLIENRAMFQDEQDNKQEIIESQSLRIKELEECNKTLEHGVRFACKEIDKFKIQCRSVPDWFTMPIKLEQSYNRLIKVPSALEAQILSPSKEQKEGEETYCNCNTPKDFDKDWIGKLCPDCNKEIVGPF